MTFLLGMLIGSGIAGMAFLVGYGCGVGHALRPVPTDGPDGEPITRADAVARLTPTIPVISQAAQSETPGDDGRAPLSAATVDVLVDIQRRRLVLGTDATLAQTMEIM